GSNAALEGQKCEPIRSLPYGSTTWLGLSLREFGRATLRPWLLDAGPVGASKSLIKPKSEIGGTVSYLSRRLSQPPMANRTSIFPALGLGGPICNFIFDLTLQISRKAPLDSPQSSDEVSFKGGPSLLITFELTKRVPFLCV